MGGWRGSGTERVIEPVGPVCYKRLHARTSTSLELPLKKFQGDDFVVGFGPMPVSFQVSSPPHRDAEPRKTTVDGVERTRALG